MSKKQKAKKARAIDPKLAKRYKAQAAERGYHFSTFEWLAARDPAFEKARLPLVEATYLRKDPVLPVKYKELIAATILAFRGYPSVGKHFKRALEAGATVQEIVEGLEIACIPGGMPTLHLGIDHLIALEREHPELFENG